jgi:hypothetical protein
VNCKQEAFCSRTRSIRRLAQQAHCLARRKGEDKVEVMQQVYGQLTTVALRSLRQGVKAWEALMARVNHLAPGLRLGSWAPGSSHEIPAACLAPGSSPAERLVRHERSPLGRKRLHPASVARCEDMLSIEETPEPQAAQLAQLALGFCPEHPRPKGHPLTAGGWTRTSKRDPSLASPCAFLELISRDMGP